jgi:hypothetical protein
MDTAEVYAAVRRHGLDDPRLLEAAEFVDVADLLAALFPDGHAELAEGVEEVISARLGKVGGAARLAERSRRSRVSAGLDDALWAAAENKKKAKIEQAASSSTAVGSRARAPGAAWRPSAKKPKREGGVLARDAVLLAKWSLRLADILSKAGAPSWLAAQESLDPDAAVAGLVGKARPATVKMRVRAWEQFARWLHWRRGRAWPSNATDLVDYVNERIGEGCAISFPETFRAAVAWIEARSGHVADYKFGGDELFRKNVDHAGIRMAGEAVMVKKAPRFLIVMVASLETHVVDEDQPLGMRILAWARLLKIFGVLRWDDLQRLRPKDVALRASGLAGRLTQTKTSGAGKRVHDLPLHVPRCAFVVRRDWLEVGFGLWSGIADPERDFFLPRLKGDLVSFYEGPASSADLATLGTLLLSELKVPVMADGHEEWSSGSEVLIPTPLLMGWTGHSERATLPSLFAAMGVPKAERDPLGRWSPSGSDDYVRTYKALVKGLAGKLRRIIEDGTVFEAADEEEALEDVISFIGQKAGGASAAVNEAAGVLRTDAMGLYKDLARDPTGKPMEVIPEVEKAVLDEVAKAAEADHDEDPYIIVMSGRGKFLRLHRSDGCWRAQGKVFQSYETYPDDPVPSGLYTSYCHDCWPREGPRRCDVAAGEAAGDSSASSSTSSTGDSD